MPALDSVTPKIERNSSMPKPSVKRSIGSLTSFKRVERLIWGLYILIPILFFTTGCSNTIEVLDGLCFNDKDGTFICDPDIQSVPTDYLDSPVDMCTQVERYEFDTPGIEAHEVITKKDCEEVIS